MYRRLKVKKQTCQYVGFYRTKKKEEEEFLLILKQAKQMNKKKIMLKNVFKAICPSKRPEIKYCPL